MSCSVFPFYSLRFLYVFFTLINALCLSGFVALVGVKWLKKYYCRNLYDLLISHIKFYNFRFCHLPKTPEEPHHMNQNIMISHGKQPDLDKTLYLGKKNYNFGKTDVVNCIEGFRGGEKKWLPIWKKNTHKTKFGQIYLRETFNTCLKLVTEILE